MKSYTIIMTDDAVADLVELRNYIANTLLAPDTALSYVKDLREEIGSLSEMPGRIKPIDTEPWHSRGVRRLIAKGFYVYFRIDEDEKIVFVLNIIYSKRDQLMLLARIPFEQ